MDVDNLFFYPAGPWMWCWNCVLVRLVYLDLPIQCWHLIGVHWEQNYSWLVVILSITWNLLMAQYIIMPYLVPTLTSDWLMTVGERKISHVWRHQHDLSHFLRHSWHYNKDHNCGSLQCCDALLWPSGNIVFVVGRPSAFFHGWMMAD